MDLNEETLLLMYKSLISDGEYLLQEVKDKLTNVRGAIKLQHKIKRDIKSLTEAMLHNKMKKEHVACSNMSLYKGMIEEIMSQNEIESVLEVFLFKLTDNCQMRLTVDIVSEKGQKWTKIIARNPLALQYIYKDGDGFGRRSVIDQAKSYLQAANQNLFLYSPPEVMFNFVNGIPVELKTYLENIGIIVKGRELVLDENPVSSWGDSDDDDDDDDDVSPSPYNKVSNFPLKNENTNKLNLCVTTMIAYVSSLTNGGCNKRFLEPLLNQQAEWERVRPVKPLLSALFEGKTLIACSTSVEDFKNIIENIGGEEEKSRAEALLASVEVVPDVPFTDLKPSGQIKTRSLVIFGTGLHHRAVTISANKGFVHSSKQKGVKFAVIIHESRALTERKELPEID